MSEAEVIEVLPPEASSWGKNAFYHSCSVIEQKRSFAACMHTIGAVEKGNEHYLNEESCLRAIKNGSCEAMAMRAEEVAAGKALYYQERVRPKAVVIANNDDLMVSKNVDRSSDSYQRGWNQAGGRPKHKVNVRKIAPPKAKPEPKTTATTTQDAMAQVISEMAQEEQSKAPAKMTMAERVRLMRESKRG